jgi:uncharacterized protein (DUF4213/DUF364 family)
VTILNELLNTVLADSPDLPVQDVLIGLYWTAVTSRATGVASTLAPDPCCLAEEIGGVGHLHECSAHELASLLLSDHMLEVGVGLAALNSLITIPEERCVEINARDLMLERSHGRKVALIGHFGFAKKLREAADEVWVLELEPGPGDLPAEAAPELVPQADVVGLTANTLMNGTFEGLAELFAPGALTVMIGPSTPMCPVLFEYGVEVLAGSQVGDPAALWRYAGQGSSLHRVPGLRRLILAREG